MALWSDSELLGYLRGLGATIVTVGSAEVHGLYRRPYSDAGDVEGYSPTLLCRSGDVPHAEHGTVVTISAGQYRVVEIRPQEDGYTLLVLEDTD